MMLESLAEKLLFKRIDKKIPKVAPGELIPKTIYQISPTSAPLPAVLAENALKLRSLNPGWHYELFDQPRIEVFLVKYFPKIKKYYDQISDDYPAAKADLFRYLLLYKCGGVYLDLKSGMNRPLDQTLPLDSGYILSDWSEWRADSAHAHWGLHPQLKHLADGEYQQWHIICSPGHPYLRQVLITVLVRIKLYLKNRHGVGRKGILQITGPIPYSLAIEKIRPLYKYKLLRVREKLGLEYNNLSNIDHTKLFPGKHYSLCNSGLLIASKRRALVDGAYGLLKGVMAKP